MVCCWPESCNQLCFGFLNRIFAHGQTISNTKPKPILTCENSFGHVSTFGPWFQQLMLAFAIISQMWRKFGNLPQVWSRMEWGPGGYGGQRRGSWSAFSDWVGCWGRRKSPSQLCRSCRGSRSFRGWPSRRQTPANRRHVHLLLL